MIPMHSIFLIVSVSWVDGLLDCLIPLTFAPLTLNQVVLLDALNPC